MSEPLPPHAEVEELHGPELLDRQQELSELTRAAAAAGLAPGFPSVVHATWLDWHWRDVMAREDRRETRVFVARADDRLVGAAELWQLRSPGWGGWEPWKRLEIRNVIVHPDAPDGIEQALLDFMLRRSLADFVAIEVPEDGALRSAAEQLAFRPVATIPDRMIGGDGAPLPVLLLTRAHPIPSPIRSDVLAQVEAVEPSVSGELLYRPCEVTLRDGRVLDRVYVQEAWTWKQSWGVWPEDDRGKAAVSIDEVARVAASPSRLAPALANRLLDAGETGMGYTKFTAVLRDGRRLNVMTGNAVDFVDLVPGVTGADIVDVLPHVHEGIDLPTSIPSEPTYRWCLYTLPEDRARIERARRPA